MVAGRPNRTDQINPALRPTSLSEMLAIPREQLPGLDLARMNLLCAEGLPGAEDLDVEAGVTLVDSWAGHIAGETQHYLPRYFEAPGDDTEAMFRMLVLTTELQKRFGVKYNERLEQGSGWDWKDAGDVLISGIVGPERHGSCASLPVVIVALARRLGYPMFLVHTVAHTFSRWDGLGPGTHTHHEVEAYRDLFNVECHGRGMVMHPDEYYQTWPVQWSSGLLHEEARRNPPLYLRTLTVWEELAYCLTQRSHVLLENEQYDNAFFAAWHAVQYAPHHTGYHANAQQVVARKCQAVLKPWNLGIETYISLLRQRLSGAQVTMPWEKAGRCPYRPDAPRGTPLPPSHSPIADVLGVVANMVRQQGNGPSASLPPEALLHSADWKVPR